MDFIPDTKENDSKNQEVKKKDKTILSKKVKKY
jgi:hypothetical protein